MTLDDLRAQLQELAHLPGDTLVVLAKDAEGNGYSPLSTVDHAMYAAYNTWSGEHYASPETRAAEPDEWDEAPDDAVPALFLWPVN